MPRSHGFGGREVYKMAAAANYNDGSKKYAKVPKGGPFNILGQFNSSRSPEKVYTVKEHLDVPSDTGKRISCTCPGWKFSLRKRGYYGCKHTDYVAAGHTGDAFEKVEKSIITKTVRSTRVSGESLKSILAQAFSDSGVHVSDHSFKKLHRNLVRLLDPDLRSN
jgi:hypothetical protein